MNVVFMGTPDFAAESLKQLLSSKHTVSAVFTKQDMPRGRKMIMTPPEVKVLALEHNLPVYQPKTLKDEEVINQIKEINPDVIAVVAYGKLLPPEVLDIPKYGCINVHGSLLPKYRGAAPIQWTVLNGDEYGGVTTMYMAEGLDTGDMILTYKTRVGENETSGELFDRLAVEGGKLLLDTLELLEKGQAPRIPQNESEATHAPMLSRESCQVDFEKTASEVHNLIRGLSPWPVAQTTLEGKKVKLISSRVSKLQGNPGEVISVNPLTVACKEGSVEILTLQLEGKKAMESKAFLLGHKLNIGDKFG